MPPIYCNPSPKQEESHLDEKSASYKIILILLNRFLKRLGKNCDEQ